MFQKINIDFSDINLNNFRGSCENVYGETFKVYSVKNLEHLYKKINEKIKFKIKPTRINITDIHGPGVDPHTDVWPVSLNFYFTANSNNEVTTFFKKANNNFVSIGNVKKFKEEDLIPIDTFIANEGDCYLLNTFIPHNVKMKNVQDVRTILRFVWFDHSFQQVLDGIDIY
jgi:hypothetical protein